MKVTKANKISSVASLFLVIFSIVFLLSRYQIKIDRYYIIAALLYIFSHFLRSVRFWFNISIARDISVQKSVFINFTANAVGNVFFFVPFIKELLILLLSLLNNIKEIGRIIFVIIYIRIFDLLFAITLLLLLNKPYSYEFYLTFAAAFLIFLLLVFAHKIINLFSDYFTKYHHNIFSLKVVEYLALIKKFLERKKPYKSENIFINALLTIICWGVEIVAVTLLTKSGSSSLDIVLRNVTMYFDRVKEVVMPDEYVFLFLALSLVSLVVIMKKIRNEISRH